MCQEVCQGACQWLVHPICVCKHNFVSGCVSVGGASNNTCEHISVSGVWGVSGDMSTGVPLSPTGIW